MLTPLALQQNGRENQKNKSWKLVGWNKESLISEAKRCAQGKWNKEYFHYFPSAGRYFDTSWKAGCINSELGRQMSYLQMSLPSSSRVLTFIAHDFIEYGQFWPVWVSCSGCVPSQPLVYSQATCWVSSMRNRESLDAALFSNRQNTDVLSSLV